MYQNFKRIIDFFVAAIALYILMVPLAIIALIIFFTDFKNPFFFHERVGMNLKKFRLIKFRSMVFGAHKKGSHQTKQNDERITHIGEFLRKYSIDELPQLINVFLGDMSLIGPRPDTPMQEKDYSKTEWQKRHAVRPGITGLAQVNGRSNIGQKKRIALDLQYAKEISFFGDLKILIKTFSLIFNNKDSI